MEIETEMEIDHDVDQTDVFGNSLKEIEVAMDVQGPGGGGEPEMTTLSARIETDGLLLYVSEASYQPVSICPVWIYWSLVIIISPINA